MKLTLKRMYLGPDYTIGKLYLDGEYICDTLEDTYREVKIKDETCIPFGTYSFVMNVVSPKYSTREQYLFCEGKLPRLLNVPGFEGILIHIGNTKLDTSGCILVGENKVKGQVINSTLTFKRMYQIISDKLKVDPSQLTIIEITK